MGRSLNDFLNVLEASNLLTAQQIQEVRELAVPERTPRSVAKVIVQQGWLTRWQAQQLLAGRSKLFLGKYKLLDCLGRGGMGAVFRAEQPRLNRIVAVKVMATNVLNDAIAVDRFLREIRAVASLSHPNIVSAYDADQVGNTYLLVMEHVDGVDLEAWLTQHGQVPIAWAAEVVRQVALGLEHAHKDGIVHRDIKPRNILIARPMSGSPNDSMNRPQAKLLDLGLAKFASETHEEGGLTRTGQIMGTPDFIAPEQAQSTKDADIRADIFGLGCVFFRMLTGQLPFTGSNVMEKLMARTATDAPHVSDLRPEVSPQLDAIVAKMLARDPASRYQTPGELAHELVNHALGTIAEPDETIMLEPVARRKTGRVEAKADPTLNQFLNQMDNRESGDIDETPQARLASETPRTSPKPSANRQQVGIQVALAVAGMLFLGLIWWGVSRDKGLIVDSPPPKTLSQGPPTEPAPSLSSDSIFEWNPDWIRLPNGWQIGPAERLGPNYSLIGDDQPVFLSADELSLLVTSTRSGGQGRSDLWEWTRPRIDSDFANPVNLGPGVNSPDDELEAQISADGLTIIFRSNRPGGSGSWDLWMSQRAATDQQFENAVNLGNGINNKSTESSPVLSQDGLTLIFHSAQSGKNRDDLWMSQRADRDAPWGKRINLGPKVNSPSRENRPTLDADALTLVFSSNRPGGQGESDIWICTRPSKDQPFRRAFNPWPAINTSKNEYQVSLSGRTLIFRRGSDFYQAQIKRPDINSPKLK